MKALRSLIRYMAPYKVAAIIAPLLMALEVAMDLAQPRLLQTIVDVGIANADLDMVMHTGLVMVGVALVGAVGGIGCTIYATSAGINFGTDIRADLFRKIQGLSFGDLDRLETGRLVTRLTNDVDQVQEAALMLLRILVRAPLLVVGSLIMAVVTSPRLSLLLLVISPVLVLAFLLISGRAHALFMRVQDRLDRLNVIIQENLAGVRVVKAFVRSAHESNRFGAGNDDLMHETIRATSLLAGVQPIMMLMVNMGVVGVIWFGGLLVKAEQVHVGQIMAFINYLMQMLSSLMMVGMLVVRVARADASAERISEVLEAEPELKDDPEAVEMPVERGKVQFDNVTFSYDGEGSEPVVKGVSFSAEPGETIAILGSTGSGKSTLVHLIPRLYDVNSGSVLIDGVDVRKIRQDDLRGEVGIVLQDAILFSGTVTDNIRYGCPDASDEQVREAARIARADTFIEALPDGYDTVLGQRGVNLSGGQKQRLALARALICRPGVLILDDCTSAVDASTEAEIIRALDEWPHACTRLVVAQRVSTVVRADRVLLLEDGMISAEGTHEELSKTSPIYQEILRSQLGEEEIEDV